ncbi:MAG TPA: hypothetical protein VMO47_11510, partial [Rhodothermales bacterium]|nr:hypothetical protein [Rhodothermales bacterium]
LIRVTKGVHNAVVRTTQLLLACVLLSQSAAAQFIDEFDGPNLEQWSHVSGDGSASIEFVQGEGHGTILVDATRDSRNIWWAFIKNNVAPALDLNLLEDPDYELRVEARIRTSHAPRRVNLHLNTQRTADFHSHLMEFDIPDTAEWHTISMTTRGFDAEPGDVVNAQMALIDWGRGRYRVDVDYFRVDVVDAKAAGPDRGEPLPYHPPIPDPASFEHSIPAAQDAMIDLEHPDANFNGWYAADARGKAPVLTVNGTLVAITRWDLEQFARASCAGLLELTTHSVQRTQSELEEFGKVRIVEILAGDPEWDQETVTLTGLIGARALDDVLNEQMIIDVDVAESGRTYATISRPVLQRLLDGTTRGLAIRSLGAINVAFYALEQGTGPRLLFSTD